MVRLSPDPEQARDRRLAGSPGSHELAYPFPDPPSIQIDLPKQFGPAAMLHEVVRNPKSFQPDSPGLLHPRHLPDQEGAETVHHGSLLHRQDLVWAAKTCFSTAVSKGFRNRQFTTVRSIPSWESSSAAFRASSTMVPTARMAKSFPSRTTSQLP
jgi:hypothetical protein